VLPGELVRLGQREPLAERARLGGLVPQAQRDLQVRLAQTRLFLVQQVPQGQPDLLDRLDRPA